MTVSRLVHTSYFAHRECQWTTVHLPLYGLGSPRQTQPLRTLRIGWH